MFFLVVFLIIVVSSASRWWYQSGQGSINGPSFNPNPPSGSDDYIPFFDATGDTLSGDSNPSDQGSSISSDATSSPADFGGGGSSSTDFGGGGSSSTDFGGGGGGGNDSFTPST